jgi:hypothetical protein
MMKGIVRRKRRRRREKEKKKRRRRKRRRRGMKATSLLTIAKKPNTATADPMKKSDSKVPRW